MPQPQPRVSVIIPCYKMGRFVSQALESVGDQTYSDWEVVVVDDAGPEDGTGQAVANFAGRFPAHRVEYIRHATNRGVSAARNTAIRHAQGAFLAFLDPDDFWLPQKLAEQMRAWESPEDPAFSYAQARILRVGAGLDFAPGLETVGKAPREEIGDGVAAIASGEVLFALSTLVVKKSAYDQVGGFKENLPFMNEDRLLAGCCALVGQMTWVPKVLCVYRLHDGSVTMSVIKRELSSLVEFDLAARIALWLRQQAAGRRIGAQMVAGLLSLRLKQTLATSSWFKWRGLLASLLIKLFLAYPLAATFLICQFLLQAPGMAAKRAWRRLTQNKMNAFRPGQV